MGKGTNARRIPHILDQAQGNCILINTLFFKGGWIFPFDPAETRQEYFYPVGGKKHPVSMMHLSDQWFAFHKAELFEMATLPYGNDFVCHDSNSSQERCIH